MKIVNNRSFNKLMNQDLTVKRKLSVLQMDLVEQGQVLENTKEHQINKVVKLANLKAFIFPT